MAVICLRIKCNSSIVESHETVIDSVCSVGDVEAPDVAFDMVDIDPTATLPYA